MSTFRKEIEVKNVKSSLMLFLCVVFAVVAWGYPTIPASLPAVVYADAEVSTNVPFRTVLDVSGQFSFSLSCRATSSNNVEVAFGTDANGNGVLEPEETDRVIGWDCGSWFTRKGADGAYVASAVASTNEVRTLSWRLRIASDGNPSALAAMAEGVSVFTDLPLESVYRPSWNLLRLTGRGLDTSLETFSVSVTPDGTVFIMR